MKKISRRSFLKGTAVAASALVIKPKTKKIVKKKPSGAIYGPSKTVFNSEGYAVMPLTGAGVSGDSIMTGNEEMPLFYEDI